MEYDILKDNLVDAVIVTAEALHAQVVSILMALNVPEEHADITADALVMADLRGVITHGVHNVVGYADYIQTGRYTIPQKIKVLSQSPSTALLSNGDGLGFVGAYHAMQIAIEKAQNTGVGQVAIRDGHHIGMLAYFPMMALEFDMIGFTMTNGGRLVRPLWGSHPRVGTNPIAFAAPAGDERPFILDMATSIVANMKVYLANLANVSIPEGWVTDAQGNPVTDPPIIRSESWALNPIGITRELGGHKGYGLGVMVDILTGVLSGGGFGAKMPAGENQTWVMAIDISKFRPIDEFKEMMDAMIQELHATPPIEGIDRVLVAGDPEADAYDERYPNNIPIPKSQIKAIRVKAKELNSDIYV